MGGLLRSEPSKESSGKEHRGLGAIAHRVGQKESPFTDEMFDRLLEFLDVDGNGEVDLHELLEVGS